MLDEDFCTIAREAGADYFIRGVLEIPIHGIREPLSFSVWVSLSERSFNRYRETYNDPVPGDGFFGWVCNEISLYPYGHARPADVRVLSGRRRPTVILHRSDPEDDDLVLDQTEGISVARAQQLAELVLHDR